VLEAMTEIHRFHPGGFDGPGGWHMLGGILPMLLFFILIGVGIWAVIRVTSANRAQLAGAGAAPIPRLDPALEELRLQYARGDVSREEFVQRSRDLGATVPQSEEPPPPRKR
jgi:putative membrane protein